MEREVERRNIKLFSCRSFSSFFFSYLSDNAKSVFLCVCVIPFAGSVFFFPTRTKKDNRPAALKIPVGSAGLAVKAHYLSLNAER